MDSRASKHPEVAQPVGRVINQPRGDRGYCGGSLGPAVEVGSSASVPARPWPLCCSGVWRIRHSESPRWGRLNDLGGRAYALRMTRPQVVCWPGVVRPLQRKASSLAHRWVVEPSWLGRYRRLAGLRHTVESSEAMSILQLPDLKVAASDLRNTSMRRPEPNRAW